MIVMGNLWTIIGSVKVEKKKYGNHHSELNGGISTGTMLEHTIPVRYRMPERHEIRSGGIPVGNLTGGVLRWGFLSCG